MNIVLYEGPFADEEGEREKGSNSMGFLISNKSLMRPVNKGF